MAVSLETSSSPVLVAQPVKKSRAVLYGRGITDKECNLFIQERERILFQQKLTASSTTTSISMHDN